MANKKSTAKAATNEPLIEKIAGKLGHMTGEVIVAKNNLVNMAGGAIDTVKSTIKNITAKKKPEAKKAVKAAVKKVVKKATPAKKAIKKVVKKAAPVKKAVKKVMKKAVKKVTRKK